MGFPASDRFTNLGVLGAGGVGIVYQAYDRERGAKVALKVLKKPPYGNSMLVLKDEFRQVQGLDHPNLVKLHQLVEHRGEWFYTMELIEGVDFLNHVRPSPAAPATESHRIGGELLEGTWTLPSEEVDELPAVRPRPRSVSGLLDVARLRPALAQLAGALHFLHERDQVHRDIKPSNILVTPEGRVVLLDFGLLAAPGIAPDRSGTPEYMSPEQAASRFVGPESDWYSVGVVLYRALTGVFPDRSDEQALAAPRMLAAWVPEDLEGLCTALLRIEPGERPPADEILRRLGVRRDARAGARVAHAGRQLFVGRRPELETLTRAYQETRQGKGVTVLISGESGVGKTRLVSRFGESLRGQALVLSGRCYEREAVPYKAFDEIIDGLSEYLRDVPVDRPITLAPQSIALLRGAFPVLGRVPALARIENPELTRVDPLALRARVFAALRELFDQLSARQPLILLIDDLQWADRDSLVLLAELMGPPTPPPLLLLATLRTPVGDELAELQDRLASAGALKRVDLVPLPLEDATELAAGLVELLREGGRSLEPSRVAQEARGHPLFIQELVRHAMADDLAEHHIKLEDALQDRLRQLSPSAHEVMRLLALAGRPISPVVAAHSSGLSLDRVLVELDRLQAQNLARTWRVQVEPYHDRVREALISGLDEADQARCHRSLALAFQYVGDADAETLAIHWKGAGEVPRARHFTVLAADQAGALFAFDRAARLYRSALELEPEAAEAFSLKVRRAHALANAGRGVDAAQAFMGAAKETLDGRARLELQRMAADQLVRSGHIDTGIELFGEIVAKLGLRLPRTRLEALMRLLWVRLRLRLRGLGYRECAEASVSAIKLSRIDLCFALGSGLSTFDHLEAPLFYNQSILLALNAGEPMRVARALALEGIQHTVTNLDPGAFSIMATSKRLAERLGDPSTLGLVSMCRGIVEMAHGRWNTAYEHCQQAKQILRERCGGFFWERSVSELSQLYCLFYLGRLPEATKGTFDLIREAQQRNDSFSEMNARIHYHNLAWLQDDRIEDARAAAMAAQATRAIRREFTGFDLWTLLALVNIDLYAGEPARAWERVATAWPKVRRSLMFNVIPVRVEGLYLYGRAALGHPGLPATKRARLVHRIARGLDRLGVPWAAALGGLLHACAAKVAGDTERAIGELRAVAAVTKESDMNLHAAIAGRCLGQLLNGVEGQDLLMSADALLQQQSFRRPDRLIALLAPSFAN